MILLLIAGVFVAPIVLAWAFVTGLLDWRGQGMVNKGALLREPIALSPMLGEAAQAFEGFNGTWSVLYLGAGDCPPACRHALLNLHKIYELTGHEQTRVRVFYAELGAASSARVEFPEFAPVTMPPRAAEQLGAAVYAKTGLGRPVIGLVDHRGNWMMAYDGAADPKAMLDDLKRLLRASNTG